MAINWGDMRDMAKVAPGKNVFKAKLNLVRQVARKLKTVEGLRPSISKFEVGMYESRGRNGGFT